VSNPTLPCPHGETAEREWFVWRHPTDHTPCASLNAHVYRQVADDWFTAKDGSSTILDIQKALLNPYDVTALLTPHGLVRLVEWLCEGWDAPANRPEELKKWATRQAKRVAGLLVSPVHLLVYEEFSKRVTNFVTNVGFYASKPNFGIRVGNYPSMTSVQLPGKRMWQMLPITNTLNDVEQNALAGDMQKQFENASAVIEGALKDLDVGINQIQDAFQKAAQAKKIGPKKIGGVLP
jgi:hypothetical protein